MYKIVPGVTKLTRLLQGCQRHVSSIDNYNDYLKLTIRLIQPYYLLDDCPACCVRSRSVYYD